MKRFVLLALSLVLAGYVGAANKPVSQNAMAPWQGKTITATERAKPDFAAMTAGKAGFALIGALAMISAGNKIVSDNAIEDPAVAIRDALLEDLSRTWQLTVIPVSGTTTGKNIKEMAKRHPDADLLLDVQTSRWDFGYFSTDWSHYRVMYGVKLRLIDIRKAALIAEGSCVRVPKTSDGAPTQEELLANGAARLKQELANAGEQCRDELKSKVFGVAPAT